MPTRHAGPLRSVIASVLLLAAPLAMSLATPLGAQRQPPPRVLFKVDPQRVLNESGKAVACIEPLNDPAQRTCVYLAFLVANWPETALPLEQLLTRLAQDAADKARAPITPTQAADQFISSPKQVACAGMNGGAAAIIIAKYAPSGTGRSTGDSCIPGSGIKSPLDALMPDLGTARNEVDDMIEVYQGVRSQCEAERQQSGRGTGAIADAGGAKQGNTQVRVIQGGSTHAVSNAVKQVSGKLWEKVVDLIAPKKEGDKDTPVSNDAPGVRGACLDETQCASCEARAFAAAIEGQIHDRMASKGCSPVATANPDAPGNGCVNARVQPNRLTPEQIALMRKAYCEERSGIMMPGPNGSAFCRLAALPTKPMVRQGVCSDPRAMCSEDHTDLVMQPFAIDMCKKHKGGGKGPLPRPTAIASSQVPGTPGGTRELTC